jgi:hypothetical protein
MPLLQILILFCGSKVSDLHNGVMYLDSCLQFHSKQLTMLLPHYYLAITFRKGSRRCKTIVMKLVVTSVSSYLVQSIRDILNPSSVVQQLVSTGFQQLDMGRIDQGWQYIEPSFVKHLLRTGFRVKLGGNFLHVGGEQTMINTDHPPPTESGSPSHLSIRLLLRPPVFTNSGTFKPSRRTQSSLSLPIQLRVFTHITS